ncbi:TerD family protein [Streptomyces sp. 21So2-11]|uniref:TerD family protein n=1 Tax=Streptomyces sp. 21So2-11 TaxID=3144408 RepID=UPI00321A0C0A
MSSLNKGIGKVEVTLKWDPSPLGAPANDLDIIAATYSVEEPHGSPVYVVHFGSRAPDGTITLNRDSRTGLGLGYDEVMTLEFDRLSAAYARVMVGVAIQQGGGQKTFGDIVNTNVRISEGHTVLTEEDFAVVSSSTAATIAEFTRDETGGWEMFEVVRGFDTDPNSFAQQMGNAPT